MYKRQLHKEDSSVTITVIDNGKGLPETQRDRLTEPYITTRTKGTGLGLAIVKRIVEQHEGYLRLEDIDKTDYPISEPKKSIKGAKISIVFPVRSESSKSGKI